jgi:hypothetical protein
MEETNDEILESIVRREDSYTPDIFSHSNVWQTGLKRDPISGTQMMWALSYELPSGNGWKAEGVYHLGDQVFKVDRTSPRREHVYKHEAAHRLGGDEYFAEKFASGCKSCNKSNNYSNAA